ncbi:hypothetical protein GCM10017710_25810 [Arthrobacter ramosus]
MSDPSRHGSNWDSGVAPPKRQEVDDRIKDCGTKGTTYRGEASDCRSGWIIGMWRKRPWGSFTITTPPGGTAISR